MTGPQNARRRPSQRLQPSPAPVQPDRWDGSLGGLLGALRAI